MAVFYPPIISDGLAKPFVCLSPRNNTQSQRSGKAKAPGPQCASDSLVSTARTPAHEPRRCRQSCSGSDVAKPCLHTGKQVRLFAMRATQRGDGAWQRSSLRLGQCQYRLHSGKHGHRTTVACKEDLVGAPTRRWATLSVVRQLLLDASGVGPRPIASAVLSKIFVSYARGHNFRLSNQVLWTREVSICAPIANRFLAWGMTRLSRLPSTNCREKLTL